MDWQTAQLLIVPALTVLFQALKKALGEKDYQWLPLAAVLGGIIATVLWTLAAGFTDPSVLAEAILRGAVIGAGAVGLYELSKATVARIL